jgi:hypothetical protein
MSPKFELGKRIAELTRLVETQRATYFKELNVHRMQQIQVPNALRKSTGEKNIIPVTYFDESAGLDEDT